MNKLMVYLPDDLYEALRKQSFETKQSMSKIVRQAISDKFEYLKLALSKKELKSIKSKNPNHGGQPFDFSMDRKK